MADARIDVCEVDMRKESLSGKESLDCRNCEVSNMVCLLFAARWSEIAVVIKIRSFSLVFRWIVRSIDCLISVARKTITEPSMNPSRRYCCSRVCKCLGVAAGAVGSRRIAIF